MKVWIIPVENQIRTDSSEVDIYLLLGEEGAEGEGGGLGKEREERKGEEGDGRGRKRRGGGSKGAARGGEEWEDMIRVSVLERERESMKQ